MEQAHQTLDPAERRAYARNPIYLRAVCVVNGEVAYNCVIRDFCSGGLYLEYDPSPHSTYPAPGTLVAISCTVPTSAQRIDLAMQARIARTTDSFSGISFLKPDPNVVIILQDYANSLQTRQHSRQDPAHPSVAIQQDLVKACQDMVVDQSTRLASQFLDDCTRHLKNRVETEKDTPLLNALFAAQGVFDRTGPDFTHKLRDAIQAHLDEFSVTASPGGPQQPDQPPTTELKLVEDDAFDQWLTMVEISNPAETRNKHQLTLLEQRLSVIYEIPVQNENNPFSPTLLAKAYFTAMEQTGIDSLAFHDCHIVFKKVLADFLESLYEDLNQLLIRHHILPDLENTLGKPQKNETVTPAREEEPAADEQAQMEGQVLPQQTEQTLDTHGQEKPQTFFDLASDLRSLQDGIISQRSMMPSVAADGNAMSPATTHGPVSYFNTDEVLQALSRLPQHNPVQNTQNAAVRDYCGQVNDLLSAQNDSNEERYISRREQNIMSIAGNLFSSLLQDMLIAANVRDWLQQLEIPLLKLAIVDESLFHDKDHAARQVVNKLSQLELYRSADSDLGESAICRKINSLLDKITEETALDINVYEHISQELGLLIKIQDEAYNANLGDLVKTCDAEQQILITQESDNASVTIDNSIGHSEHLQHWIEKVNRIKIGDWLLFSEDPENLHRLRLAWISKKRDRYVFVNLRGLRECTLTQLELAEQLAGKTVIPLDNADDPALDRAQYTMLQNLHKQLLHESSHDPLTGLLNRHSFENNLRTILNEGEGAPSENIFCYLKIRQFNLMNSACGNQEGDRFLAEVAKQLKQGIKQEALLARLGGSKFGILLKHCQPGEARKIIQQLIAEMQNACFSYDTRKFTLNFSIGLVAVEDHNEITSLLQAGESCCKVAENKGSNYIQVYSADDEEIARQQNSVYWLDRVNDALENDTLAVRCQPIVPITTDGYGSPHHSEVLLYMTDDDGNAISPEDFVLAAEHFDKMPEIDKWVIKHTFQWLRDNPHKLSTVGSFAINLSGRSLNDSGFRDFILETCNNTDISMEHICFEVTETAGISNLSSAAAFILELKETGCSFSLDDFGSGMSSYGYLKNLPVDYLKIDGIFVKEMDKNPHDFAVVKSICEIGHFMGKKIIAEYVESEAILEQLRIIGVDYAQGYAVGKPSLLKSL